MSGHSSGPIVLEEEEQEGVKEFTNTILLKNGSSGGNKGLFINSRAALNRGASNSPLKNSQSGFLSQNDPNSTADYKTLKKNQETSRMLANRTSQMQSSISIKMIERELSPLPRKGSMDSLHKEGNEIQVAAEQLIHDLTIDLDETQENEETLEN